MSSNEPQKSSGEWPHVDRRTKPMPDGVQVTLEDVWELLKDINNRLSTIEHRYGYISSAFVKNDLDKPDYDGHRRAHLSMIKAGEAMEGYKQEGTKGIIKMTLGFFGGIFALGVIETIRKHLGI